MGWEWKTHDYTYLTHILYKETGVAAGTVISETKDLEIVDVVASLVSIAAKAEKY